MKKIYSLIVVVLILLGAYGWDNNKWIEFEESYLK